MYDVLKEDPDVCAWYDVHQLSRSWLINHQIDLLVSKPVTDRKENNSTCAPSVSNSYRDIGNGKCKDEGVDG